ncbi:alpha-galactosidase [Paenibacillus odorifer]|uniref:alpha-galactosidase n=1 Tax=Paenibacillus TaxID=44249 RepID=UPI00096C520A|nr:alpha-galactosidase [Paenibacillus odorifer]OMC73085.1 alpha-galactosidase [Paenibacillus odorifer]OMD64747.1 alpha-galactosidase [Paenibacillus odorifer]
MLTDSNTTVNVNTDTTSLIRVTNGLVNLEIDLGTGESSVVGGTSAHVKGIRSAFRWQGREYNTEHYQSHVLKLQEEVVREGFGKGVHLVIVHETSLLPQLEQHFYIYESSSYVLMQSVIASDEDIKANRMAVIQSKSVSLGGESGQPDEPSILRVPYDNDKWVRYTVVKPPMDTESYEVTAVFAPDSRRGIIMGSITHKVWKTGIRIKSERSGQIEELDLYGGAVSELTRDFQPHGYVKGKRVESPLVFVGFYDDYREGLEAYGRANTWIEAPLAWEGGVPVGWNSWSAAMADLDYDLYTSTSEFLKKEVQPLGFQNEDTLYINFDAFWDNFTAEEMKNALELVRKNGHRPGTYWTPFAFWGSPTQFGDVVEGTNGKYTYGDILLRDSEGEILPDVDGGLAIDPTHPGNLQRIDWYTNKFISEGFEYIKLDFLAHGALEGQHHNPEITTGIAAYHYGMSYLQNKLSPEVIGRPFFINLSIAPLFPYAFAHSRRVSCDVFGTLQDTEYMLNSLTHGWWMSDSLYRFNDPDHSVLYKSHNQEATGWHEGRSRLTASVIAGTVLLLGDDFRKEEAAARAKAWLSNKDIMDVARLGKTFRPIEGDFGKQSCDTFVLESAEENAFYIAVFNYDVTKSAPKSLSLERAGLNAQAAYQLLDLWEGVEGETSGKLEVTLEPAESKIFKLTAK